MKARVEVFLKPGVLDVEGKAIETALHGLGFASTANVRVGRVITLELPSENRSAAENEVKKMADVLLANATIESYLVEIAP